MIKRKVNEDKGLQGVFYIVDKSKSDSDQLWQLRLVGSHYVFSAVSSKEKVFECLTNACKRYKTYNRLHKALRNCEHHINEETKKKLEKEYMSIGRVYEDDVEEIVNAMESSTSPLVKKKKRTMFIPAISVKREDPVVEEGVKEPVVVAKKKVFKKKRRSLI
jgi:hypothetical protein